MTGSRYEIEKDRHGRFFAILHSRNGTPIARTVKTTSKAALINLIESIKRNHDAPTYDTTKQ